MKRMHMRASGFGYGLCFALGVAASGCIADGSDLDGSERSISSAITINVNSSYIVTGVQSNKCVGVPGGSAAHVQLDIETCNGAAAQRFRPEAMGGGFFRLRNEQTGQCIDVSGVSLADGAAILQFTCGTGTNQQWSFTDVASGAERVTARHSGKVLDVTGQGITDGTLVEQWSSNNGTNQQFRLAQALPAIIVQGSADRP